MPELRSLPELVVIWGKAASYGIMVLVNNLKDMVTKGPIKFFTVKPRERPALLDDPSVGTHGYVTIRRDTKPIKLHYVAKGEEGAPLMVFLHGYPEFWYSWRHQMAEFATDYRVVALDMRGYSESDKPDAVEEYHLDKLAEDVKLVVNELGYDSCVLVGHDWGALVAWFTAMKHPGTVHRLMICNVPRVKTFQEYVSTSSEQKKKSWYMVFFQLPLLPEITARSFDVNMFSAIFSKMVKAGKMTTEEVDAYKYTFGKSGFTHPINYYRAMWRYKVPSTKTNRVEAPTLVVWGRKDPYLCQDMAAASEKYCDDFTVHYIDKAGHWVQMEEHELVNMHMRDFLTSKL